MTTINTSLDLKAAIEELKARRESDLQNLKDEMEIVGEKLKPGNLLKTVFHDVMDLPDLKTNVLNSAIGLVTGIFAKKIVIGKTINPIKKLLGFALETFVATKITKNADEIKSTGGSILKKIFQKKNHVETTIENTSE
jgi:hypothetical protein